MTKEEKIARYSKLNQEVVPGKIAMANKAVQELAERHHAKYIDINDPLKDRKVNFKKLRRESQLSGLMGNCYTSNYEPFNCFLRSANE